MFFDAVIEAPSDPIFGIGAAFQADLRPNKVNLVVGIYKDEHLQAQLMPSVKKAKEKLAEQDRLADYLLIDGLADFYEQLGTIVFGERYWSDHRNRIYAAQAIGGTGALQLAGQFLCCQAKIEAIALPNPTWANHRPIFEKAGLVVETYPYYSEALHGLDFDKLYAAVETMKQNTALLLHTVCHNPTGCDFTLQQWEALSQLMLKKKIFPLFDCAYQGFGDGIEKDRQPIAIFLNHGHEMAIAYSCSKNFSLYCQRVGAVYVVAKNAALNRCVGSQVRRIIRSLYSNPPAHGARIVAEVLKDSALKTEWGHDLEKMRQRLNGIRHTLIAKLSAKAPERDFHFLSTHKGMFSFLDLNKSQVRRLVDEFGVYLIESGRISLAGLTPKNIDYVVDSILSV